MDKSCKGCGAVHRPGDEWVYLRAMRVDMDTDVAGSSRYGEYFCVRCIEQIDDLIGSLRGSKSETIRCRACLTEEFFETKKFQKDNKYGNLSELPVTYTCKGCFQTYTLSELVTL
jgi:DNA-directed RNA polymerase subunit RPC12/RpoP